MESSSNEYLGVDMGVIVGAGDIVDSVSGSKTGSGYCNQCLDLEAKIKNIQDSCSTLQQEIDQGRSEFKLLEDKFEALQVDKVNVENELEVMKRRNQELEDKIRQIEKNGSNEEKDDEEDEVLQLKIENSVLNCEKRKAESDVECWKSKCQELQLVVLELNKKLAKVDDIQNKAGLDANSFLSDIEFGTLQSQGSGESLTKTPGMQAKLVGGNKSLLSESGNNHVSQVRKRLTYKEERGSNKRMAPSTPVGVRPAKVVVIDLNESDDEKTTGPLCTSINESDYKISDPFCKPPIPGSRMAHDSPYCGSRSTFSNNELPSENNSKMTDVKQGEDDDMVFHNKKALDVPTPKRKRPSNIIASDSDTDDDNDKVPISMLKTKHFHGRSLDDLPEDHSIQTGDSEDEIRKLSSRRRLVKLSQREGKGCDGDEIEDDVSDSEGDSLDGFIVSGSDISDDDDISNSEFSLQSNASAVEGSRTNSEYISESDSDYGEIMSRIQRKKSDRLEWEFEGDMLAAFGKDPELCMRAVCVLYRQQTAEEQSSKATMFYNQRGFSHIDALRGSTMAEFLTGGDPQGDVQKSVKELQAHDPKGIELCRHLATKYSKQLFTIYKNKEDPFFSAS